MKKTILLLIILSVKMMHAQAIKEELKRFPFGEIQANAWLKTQLQQNLDGFTGHLDELVPELINDPIYGKGRLQKNSASKDLGNLKSGDAEGDEQYKWWNSESASNWWDGYIRHVYLLHDNSGKQKIKNYIDAILTTQDQDGYLGIYHQDLRYQFQSENGELWAKTTLLRGLFAYYEVTHDQKVLKAITAAVANVMEHYPIHASHPFHSGLGFNGGVSHGLCFTDILEKMYEHTNDMKYREYALFLYHEFSSSHQSEQDAQLKNILNEKYKNSCHGVHTYEHLRPLITAAYTAQNKELNKALEIYLKRIQESVSISGAAIGDEWIAGRMADAEETGYEYCSLHELLDSYCFLLQKTAQPEIADEIENIFYNAAQGARHPEQSSIAYLKTDNSFEMKGTKNGEIEKDRNQTRYKYSAVHQDVAVCCSPNAGRIAPYFIQNSWMKENEKTWVACLLLPNTLQTQIGENKIRIANTSNYPFEQNLNYQIELSQAEQLVLKIRKPSWVDSIHCNKKYRIENNYLVFDQKFEKQDSILIEFKTDIKIKKDRKGRSYLSYGGLIFAHPIAAKESKGRTYAPGFTDFMYEATELNTYQFLESAKCSYHQLEIHTQMLNNETRKIEDIKLVPLGKTVLRQCAF